jgi:hypothetical protein
MVQKRENWTVDQTVVLKGLCSVQMTVERSVDELVARLVGKMVLKLVD